MGLSGHGGERRAFACAAMLAAGCLVASAMPLPPVLREDGPLRSRAWTVDGHPMHAVGSGDPGGVPVLWIHGSPGSWSAFRRYLEDPVLRARAFQIAVDRPGFGRSRGEGAVRSLGDQARRIASALDAVGASAPAVVVGHSLGGPLAVHVAAEHADRVAAVVLIAPSVDPELERVRWYQHLAEHRMVSWLVPRELTTANREILPLAGELRAMAPLWSRVRGPLTVVHGVRDGLVPVGNVDYVRRMLPTDPVVLLLPDAGHLVPWTRREVVRDTVLDAIRGAARGRPDLPVRDVDPAPPVSAPDRDRPACEFPGGGSGGGS
jgi:pimeloyl-ACP methyl ester carboxylesterase